MFTINLEKKLEQSKKESISIPNELLLIKEYETFAELSKDKTLERLGLSINIQQGEKIFSSYRKSKEETSNFNQENVYHISQIKKLCLRYYLRFLPTEFYKGTIDKELPSRVNNFELAYGLECTSKNTFIMAPADSLRLEPEPKDPLFFYRINDEYFYLIHKWGGDLNCTGVIKSILSSATLTAIIIILASSIPYFIFQLWLLLILPSFAAIVVFTTNTHPSAEPVRFFNHNKWRSTKI